MRRPGIRAAGLVAGLVFSVSCLADGAAIAEHGAAGAPPCQTCHGSRGEGNAQTATPRLAGLAAPYLQRQLDAFAKGERANPIMMPIAKALSEADRKAVAAYYAGTAPPVAAPDAPTSAPSAPPASSATASGAATAASGSSGVELATRGRWSQSLPACEQCHAPGGQGVGDDFPAIAGQPAAYLVAQLKAWKAGARPPGPLGLMTSVAGKLSDEDATRVAGHFASLPAAPAARAAKGTPR